MLAKLDRVGWLEFWLLKPLKKEESEKKFYRNYLQKFYRTFLLRVFQDSFRKLFITFKNIYLKVQNV